MIQEELQSLEGIFPNDFMLIQPHTETTPGKFKIHIVPSTSDEDNFCSVDLKVTYLPDYPKRVPQFNIENSH